MNHDHAMHNEPSDDEEKKILTQSDVNGCRHPCNLLQLLFVPPAIQDFRDIWRQPNATSNVLETKSVNGKAFWGPSV